MVCRLSRSIGGSKSLSYRVKVEANLTRWVDMESTPAVELREIYPTARSLREVFDTALGIRETEITPRQGRVPCSSYRAVSQAQMQPGKITHKYTKTLSDSLKMHHNEEKTRECISQAPVT